MKHFITFVVFILFSILIINSCNDTINSEEDNLPNILITSHSDGQTVSGFVEIHCEQENNFDIIKTELWVNGHSSQVADTTKPFILSWYTKQSPDGPYEIKIKFYDSDGNEYFSAPITLNVDNSPYRPKPVNVLSVTYNKSGMNVTWEKSNAEDFLYYGILHFIGENGPQGQNIPAIRNINDTTLTLTTFNPTDENWFRVVVADTQGYYAYGESLVNEIEQPPMTPILQKVINEDGSYQITWGKNTEDDFLYYILYGSDFTEMRHKYVAYFSDNSNDTTFMINIGKDELKFYQLEVVDYWNLSSNSDIKCISSYPKVAFVSTRDGTNDVFTMDSDGTNVVNLTESDAKESYPQPFPNNSNLLFLRSIWGANGFRDEIFIMNEDGTNQIQLSINSSSKLKYPVISPDGSKIAYADHNGIHIIDVNGGNNETILEVANVGKLDFSMDGEKIVYTRHVTNENYSRFELLGVKSSNNPFFTPFF